MTRDLAIRQPAASLIRPEARSDGQVACACILFALCSLAALGTTIAAGVRGRRWDIPAYFAGAAGINLLVGLSSYCRPSNGSSADQQRLDLHGLDAGLSSQMATGRAAAEAHEADRTVGVRRHQAGPIQPIGPQPRTWSDIAKQLPPDHPCRIVTHRDSLTGGILPPAWTRPGRPMDWNALTSEINAALERGDSVLIYNPHEQNQPFWHVESVGPSATGGGETRINADWAGKRQNFISMESHYVVICSAEHEPAAPPPAAPSAPEVSAV
jgi:hypothetical protein